jgi:hypothetical protein
MALQKQQEELQFCMVLDNVEQCSILKGMAAGAFIFVTVNL